MNWFNRGKGHAPTYQHERFGIDLEKFYHEHSPTMLEKATKLTAWLDHVLKQESKYTPVLLGVDPSFKFVNGGFSLKPVGESRFPERPEAIMWLEIVEIKNPINVQFKEVSIDAMGTNEFGLVSDTIVEDHRIHWAAMVEAMEKWSTLAYNTGYSLPISDNADFSFYPSEDGEWGSYDLGYTKEEERGKFSGLESILDEYKLVELLHKELPGGLRDIVSLVRKYDKFYDQQKHLRKAASKGCKFNVDDFVRRVPSEPRKVFQPAETWECFKVIGHLTPEQQIARLTEEPSYPPDMVLITPDLQKFVAFSGDWVASVRNKPQTHRRRS